MVLCSFLGFHKPCHIFAKSAHNLQTFKVLLYFFRCVAVHTVPVLRTYDVHFGDGKVFVEAVQRCCIAHTAAACNCCCKLVCKSAAGCVEKAVQKCTECTVWTCVVNRAADNHAVVVIKAFQCFVHLVVEHAFAAFVAGATAHTAVDCLFAEVEKICFYAVGIKLVAYLFKCCICTSVLIRGAVDHKNFFHIFTSAYIKTKKMALGDSSHSHLYILYLI